MTRRTGLSQTQDPPEYRAIPMAASPKDERNFLSSRRQWRMAVLQILEEAHLQMLGEPPGLRRQEGSNSDEPSRPILTA
jgi:hypothetical protein